ncbi:M20/M25/M40 family metallo-hydrolase [Sorangium sp. So ce131]|uniref:M20/M25/M40 family metallo-hydrolase n=1 Tax=Sorangium sp. So ce131 TaxID=3133282 RepID=UPI003F607267
MAIVSPLRRRSSPQIARRPGLGALSAAGLALALAACSCAGTAPRRLIQFGPQGKQRAWMTEDEIAVLARQVHRDGLCGGLLDVTDPRDRVPAPVVPSPALRALTVRGPSLQNAVRPLLERVSSAFLKRTVVELASFPTRSSWYPSGVAVAESLQRTLLGMSQGRVDVTVERVEHSAFEQPSLVATVRGAGPRRDELVVLGAHLDSTGGRYGDERSPGADDDASGVATVLEVFRVLVQSGIRLDRSVVFALYAGEEKGLVGSKGVAARYDPAKVLGVMQLDMTMFPAADRKITLMLDYNDRQLTDFTATLIEEYLGSTAAFSKCGYECSDHVRWARRGVPTVFPFEAPFGTNPWIHTLQDTPDKLDFEFGALFAKLGLAFAIEMAGLRPPRAGLVER